MSLLISSINKEEVFVETETGNVFVRISNFNKRFENFHWEIASVVTRISDFEKTIKELNKEYEKFFKKRKIYWKKVFNNFS